MGDGIGDKASNRKGCGYAPQMEGTDETISRGDYGVA